MGVQGKARGIRKVALTRIIRASCASDEEEESIERLCNRRKFRSGEVKSPPFSAKPLCLVRKCTTSLLRRERRDKNRRKHTRTRVFLRPRRRPVKMERSRTSGCRRVRSPLLSPLLSSRRSMGEKVCRHRLRTARLLGAEGPPAVLPRAPRGGPTPPFGAALRRADVSCRRRVAFASRLVDLDELPARERQQNGNGRARDRVAS